MVDEIPDMALSCELRDFTGAVRQAARRRTAQWSDRFLRAEFDGICAFLPQQLFSEPHRASNSAKHLIVTRRDPSIGFIDFGRTDGIIVHHRQHWRITVDENRAASMRSHDHGSNSMALRHDGKGIERPCLWPGKIIG